jgi:hypothetical protein
MNEVIVEPKNLQEAIDFIASKFVFDESGYPLIAKLSPEERIQFSLNHSLQHLTKQLGNIAAHLEDKDHGGEGDPEALRRSFMKGFVSTLRLAELLGMDANDLLKGIPEYTR